MATSISTSRKGLFEGDCESSAVNEESVLGARHHRPTATEI